ncbi:flavodoxin family protein [Rickettsiales bacterium LUAb2]
MKILIIYGSNTGNTKQLAKIIKNELISIKAKVVIINAKDLNEQYEFSEEYTLVILTCSTWGIEPAVMQEDFAKFWQMLNKTSINGKKFAVLGLGDNYYPHFCHALDLITEDLEKYGGNLTMDLLAISDPFIKYEHEILNWLKKLKNMLLSL